PPVLPSCAIATATAARAALVASSTLFCPPVTVVITVVGAGLPAVGSWKGFTAVPERGRTGFTRLFRGPAGTGLVTSAPAVDPFAFNELAAALTSATDGFDSTGGLGALAG